MNEKDINTDYNINDDELDEAVTEIVAAAGALPQLEVPDGFHDEVMRAIRVEASLALKQKEKSGLFSGLAKIAKHRYLYIAASSACIVFAIIFALPFSRSKSESAAQFADVAAESPAAAPVASPAPEEAPMAAEAGVDFNAIDGAAMDEREHSFQYEADYGGELAGQAVRVEQAESAAAQESSEGTGISETAYSENNNVTQKIIKTSYYDLEVTDFDKTVSEIQGIADVSGGYVESFNSSIYNTYNYSAAEAPPNGGIRDLKNGYICVRVPQNAYSSAKIELEGLGKVKSVSESIDNITSLYIDTAARLDVKKTEEQRLLELYGKAEKIEDLISLESRLAYVRSEIEAMTAQLQNWDRSVSFSTINISIMEVVDYTQLQSLDPSLGERIIEGFHRSAANFTYNLERLIVKSAENSIAIVLFAAVALVTLGIINVRFRKRRIKGRNENDNR